MITFCFQLKIDYLRILKAWATYLFKPQNIAYKHSCDYSKLIEYPKSTSYSDGSYFW